ncbi:hypothetical protein ACN28E_38740 [Archangium lansingense]|uniref:hypothetical protein n=1 Tax=Archangium lansingense TaxID=2995310 RepID=UPI003B79EB99
MRSIRMARSSWQRKRLWLGWVASLACLSLACANGSDGGGGDTPAVAAGTACPTSSEGTSTCASDGSAWLQCRSGSWLQVEACTSCAVGPRGVSCVPVARTIPEGPINGPTVGGPCGDVRTAGRCATPTRVELCSVPTGNGIPFLDTFDCPAGQGCMLVNGRATCSLTGACLEGDTRCSGPNQIETCINGGWVATACPDRCASSPLGSFCAAAVASRPFSARVAYEARAANESRTDWGPLFQVPAPGFLVVSSVNDGELLDIAETDATGAFSLQVPATPGPQDFVVVRLAASDQAGGLAYIVADPGFDSVGQRDQTVLGLNPRIWAYAFPTASLSDGAQLLITAAMGSGASPVYDNLRQAYAFARTQYAGTPGKPLVVWLGYGNSWTCGSCFAPLPVLAFDIPFDAQVWLGGDLGNQSFWADSVTAHELGHWTMDSYGFSPSEGGDHFPAVPTFPGQAWSEGFATWFSSNLRQNSVYLDKQGGTMFWLDIGLRSYSHNKPWQRPTPPGGLFQSMDENEVSAILWKLSNSDPTASGTMFGALAAPRMTARPFVGRGYTRHTWDTGPDNAPINVMDTGEGIPFLADYLDALVCGGVSPSTVNAATEPGSAYPYPSEAPVCTP